MAHTNVHIVSVYYFPVQNIWPEHCAPHYNLGVWPLLKIKMRNKWKNSCKALCKTAIQKNVIKWTFLLLINIKIKIKFCACLNPVFKVMYANTTHRGLCYMPSIMVIIALFQAKILFRMYKLVSLASKPLLKYAMLSFIKNSVEVLVCVL